MAHVHAYSPPMVHRDLKPENVLLAPDNGSSRVVAKLCDFGLLAVSKPCRGRTQAAPYIILRILLDGGML